MAMGLNVQSDAGDVANANGYMSVAEFKAYHDDRGNSYVAFNDTLIAQGIVRATDYVDQRFQFRGIKLLATQTTMWPRQAGNEVFIQFDSGFIFGQESVILLSDSSGNDIVGIPAAVKHATAEYALRALSSPLFQDAPAPEGGRLINAHTVKVDVIEETIQYASAQGTGTFVMPAYPPADLMLARAGLIQVGRTVYR
jgi:hypothetical protein